MTRAWRRYFETFSPPTDPDFWPFCYFPEFICMGGWEEFIPTIVIDYPSRSASSYDYSGYNFYEVTTEFQANTYGFSKHFFCIIGTHRLSCGQCHHRLLNSASQSWSPQSSQESLFDLHKFERYLFLDRGPHVLPKKNQARCRRYFQIQHNKNRYFKWILKCILCEILRGVDLKFFRDLRRNISCRVWTFLNGFHLAFHHDSTPPLNILRTNFSEKDHFWRRRRTVCDIVRRFEPEEILPKTRTTPFGIHTNNASCDILVAKLLSFRLSKS